MRIDNVETVEDFKRWLRDQAIHSSLAFAIGGLTALTTGSGWGSVAGFGTGLAWETYQLIKSGKLHALDRSIDLLFWAVGSALAAVPWLV